MWKLIVAAAIVAHLGEAQRSSYAPRLGSNYKLLPKYRTNATESPQNLGTRGGEEEDTSSAPGTLSPELQGTLEDHRFVQRVSQWPEDKQPFWFKNRHAISSMRDRDIDGGARELGGSNRGQRPQFQSSFQGASGGRGRDRGAAAFADNGDFPYIADMRRPIYEDPFLAYFRAHYA